MPAANWFILQHWQVVNLFERGHHAARWHHHPGCIDAAAWPAVPWEADAIQGFLLRKVHAAVVMQMRYNCCIVQYCMEIADWGRFRETRRVDRNASTDESAQRFNWVLTIK